MELNVVNFVNSAREFKGTRWVHGGRSTKPGIDCVGLVIVSLNQAGANVPVLLDYSRFDEFTKLIRILNSYCSKLEITWRDVEEGDILVFKGRELYNHVAIYSGKGFMIHAISDGAACVVEEEFSGKWRILLHSVYRYKGIQ